MLSSCFVRNMEELKMLDWNNLEVASTLGYSVVGLGAATYFKTDEALLANDVTVIKTNCGHTVKLLGRDSFSLYHCGAIGDGIADDTAAIQKALDVSTPYFSCRPGPGKFRIVSEVFQLGKPFVWKGEGMSSTVFLCESVTRTFNIQPNNILNSVEFSDMSFIANNQSQKAGHPISVIWPTTASWSQRTFTLNNVAFVSNLGGLQLPSFGQGLYLRNAWNARINNLFDNGEANSFSSTSGSSIILGENCTDVQITGLHSFFRYISVLAEGYTEGLTIDKAVMVCVNKGFQNTAASILGPRIINSHINAQSMCIDLLNSSQPQIINNLLYTAITKFGVTNIQLIGVVDGLINNNSLLSSNSSSNGITVLNSSSRVSTRNDMVDNDMQGQGTGIWLKAGTSGNKLKGNTRYIAGVEQPSVYDQGSNTVS